MWFGKRSLERTGEERRIILKLALRIKVYLMCAAVEFS